MNRRASCDCGQLTVDCRGEPLRVSVCHCLSCQRRTGSAFGTAARFRQGEVTIEGRSQLYSRVGGSGNRIDFHFCPTCGSTVYWEPGALPGFVVVALGAFADPQFPVPTVSIYEANRHGWLAIETAEHLD